MATSHIFYFFSLIVLVTSAFLPFQDVPVFQNRVARSPHCWSCEQEYGSGGYAGYHHPHFHSQQWSGLSRSPDGSQQQVFSGAAALADGESKSSSEAFSLASAGSKTVEGQKDTSVKEKENQQNTAQLTQNNANSNYQQQQELHKNVNDNKDSSSTLNQQSLSNEGLNTHSTTADQYLGQQHNTQLQQQQPLEQHTLEQQQNQQQPQQSLEQQQLLQRGSSNGHYRYYEVDKKPRAENLYVGENQQYVIKPHHDSGRGDIQDNTEQSRKYFGKSFNGFGQQEIQYDHGTSSGDSGRQDGNYRTLPTQYNQDAENGQTQSRSDSSSFINNENQQRLYDTRYYGNDKPRYNQGRNLHHEAENFNIDSEKRKLDRGNQLKQQESGFGTNAQSSLDNYKNTNNEIDQQVNTDTDKSLQQTDLTSKDSLQHDTQSSLNGALSLASQGVQASQKLPESGCTNCDGKGSIAYSNARSHSGSAVALSIGG